jgi:excisionase family DNA binding protein
MKYTRRPTLGPRLQMPPKKPSDNLLQHFIDNPVWTTKEVAQALGMHKRTIQRIMRECPEKLPHYKTPAGHLRFLRQDVLKYIAETYGT